MDREEKRDLMRDRLVKETEGQGDGENKGKNTPKKYMKTKSQKIK